MKYESLCLMLTTSLPLSERAVSVVGMWSRETFFASKKHPSSERDLNRGHCLATSLSSDGDTTSLRATEAGAPGLRTLPRTQRDRVSAWRKGRRRRISLRLWYEVEEEYEGTGEDPATTDTHSDLSLATRSSRRHVAARCTRS